MVNNHSDALDLAFSALSDPSRRAIVARLADSELTVGELARPLPMSLPAVSKHLRVLEGAGLVTRRREGRLHHLRLVPGGLSPAEDWIARHRAFWESRFDALQKYLSQTPEEEDKRSSSPLDRSRGPRPGARSTRRRKEPSGSGRRRKR